MVLWQCRFALKQVAFLLINSIMIFFSVIRCSPLDSAGGIALCQIFHFGNSHQIEIVLDGVLQAGRRHSKIDGILIVLARDQAVNAASTCSCNSCDAFCLRSRFIRLRIRCVVFLQVPLV